MARLELTGECAGAKLLRFDGGEASAVRRRRADRGSTTVCRLWFDGEVSVAVELHGGERFCAGAECSAQQSEAAGKKGECGAGEDLPPLPYLLGEVKRRLRIDRAMISATWARNCRTAGHTINRGP